MWQQEADGGQAPRAGGWRLGRVGAAGQDRKVVRGDRDGGARDEPVDRKETPGDTRGQQGTPVRVGQRDSTALTTDCTDVNVLLDLVLGIKAPVVVVVEGGSGDHVDAPVLLGVLLQQSTVEVLPDLWRRRDTHSMNHHTDLYKEI